MEKLAEWKGNALVYDEYINGEKILDVNNNLFSYIKKSDYLNENISDVILFSSNSDKTHCIHNCMTGKRHIFEGYYELTPTDIVSRKNKKYLLLCEGRRTMGYQKCDNLIHGHYFKYDKKNNVLLLYSCFLNISCLSNCKKRKWSSGKLEVIITKDGMCHNIYKEKNIVHDILTYFVNITNFEIREIEEYGEYGEKNYLNTSNQFKKLIKDGFVLENGTFLKFNYNNDFVWFLNQNPNLSHFNSNEQLTVNEFSKLELKPFPSSFKQKVINYFKDFIYSPYENFSYVERINDNICVIRIFNIEKKEKFFDKKDFIFSEDFESYEFFRIYFSKENIYFCKKFLDGYKYIDINNFSNTTPLLLSADLKDIKGTTLEYYEILIKNNLYHLNNTREFFDKLLLLIKYPIYEKILKIIRKDFASIIAEKDINNTLKYLLGDINKEANDISSAIGCPVYMLKYIGNCLYEKHEYSMELSHSSRYISILKKIFETDKNYLKNMNKQMFFEFVECFEIIHKNKFYRADYIDVTAAMVKTFGAGGAINYLKYLVKDSFNENNKEKAPHINMYLYCDYLKMVYELKDNINVSSYGWKLSSYNGELRKAHDSILVIYNSFVDKEKYSLLLDGFNEQKELWTNYQYEEEDFSIIIPNEPKDIVNEGIALNHCVKSYIDVASKGDTIILFIRNTCNIEKPFFTLEIKDNKIRQCHGFSNCNIDSIAGLEEFLKRFCEKKDISFNIGCERLAV